MPRAGRGLFLARFGKALHDSVVVGLGDSTRTEKVIFVFVSINHTCASDTNYAAKAAACAKKDDQSRDTDASENSPNYDDYKSDSTHRYFNSHTFLF